MKGPRTLSGGPIARYLLLGSTVFLTIAGLVMISSAAFVSDFVRTGDSTYHLKRQIMWICLGVIILVAVKQFDYHRYKNMSWTVYGVSIVGLILVLVIGVGKWGAQRWIDLGFFTIQPSEYAKFGCVMVVALLLSQLDARAISGKEFWGRLGLALGAVTALVMAQPDMGTTMSILIAAFMVLILGGVSWGLVGGLSIVGFGAVGAAILIAPYRAARFFAFLDPWADPQGSGYQTIQALLAFGSGGLDGVGVAMSRQKFFYLPAAHTDFIFAIIGEELGLVGTLSIVVAFIVFAYAGIRIAMGAKDTYGRLLAGGLTAMIVTQALMNMAAVTNLMPVTGIPLPLVSFGGSSLTFTMLCIGIILSVSTYGTRGVRAVPSTQLKEQTRARNDERRGDSRAHLSGARGGRKAARRRA